MMNYSFSSLQKKKNAKFCLHFDIKTSLAKNTSNQPNYSHLKDFNFTMSLFVDAKM